MAAGTYRTRVQRFRQSVQDALYAQPYNMTFANVVAEEEQEDIQVFIQNIQAVRDRLFSNMERSGELPHLTPILKLRQISPRLTSKAVPDAVLEGVSVSYAQKLFDAERALIETITGTNGTDNVDAITRMQMTGENYRWSFTRANRHSQTCAYANRALSNNTRFCRCWFFRFRLRL